MRGASMNDAYVAWQLALLEQQIDAFSSFLSACPWTDPAMRLTCRDLADAAREALTPETFGRARLDLNKLVDHARQWRDRPGYPGVHRPEVADALARDLVKDVLRRGDFPFLFRKQASDLKLSIDVVFRQLQRYANLDKGDGISASYVYGRATMALDLGDFVAAREELVRLEEMYKDFIERAEERAATA